MQIIARDWTSTLQTINVQPEVYTNQLTSDIVLDIMTKYGPSNITVTNVNATAVTLPRISFNQLNVFDIIRQLAELSDFIFYVDSEKDLHFEQKDSVSSGLTLDSSNTVRVDVREDLSAVKNQVFVYGARQLVAAPQESFVSDGAGSVFTLENQPNNTKVNSSGTDLIGGLFDANIQPASGTQYMVSFYDQKIVFVSGTDLGYSSIPTSGTIVTVDYQVNRPIVKLINDAASQAAYGIRTETIVDENILDGQTAKTIATNTLALKKDPPKQVNVDIYGITSMTPGQTVQLNQPYQNIVNQTYSIIEARYNFNIRNNMSDRVLKIKASERVRDITDVLKDLILSVNALKAGQIDTSQILTRIETFTGSFGLRMQTAAIRTNHIGNSFILGHPVNGVLGSPALSVLGSQIVLGDQRLGLTEVYVTNAEDSSGFKEFVRNGRFINEGSTTATVDSGAHQILF
jgi:hypothetical protein